MEATAILGFLDHESRIRAFEHYFNKLESTSPVNLDALRICVQLQASNTRTESSLDDNSACSETFRLTERLCDLLVSCIPKEPQESRRYYQLAEILLRDGPFSSSFFRHRVYPILEALYLDLSSQLPTATDIEDTEHNPTQTVRIATAYLNILKNSFWLLSSLDHIVDVDSVKLISRFIGFRELEGVAHDTLSSLLSLLKRVQPARAAKPSDVLPARATLSVAPEHALLASSLVDDSIWDQLSRQEEEHFKTGASRIFRTWFQWISLAAGANVRLECLNQDLYWARVRAGLLYGYADQRKYCIGIIRQSLLAARDDISTPSMRFYVVDRENYLKAYDQYSALFETIVLDRYSNQVQACLPELSKLLDSVVTPAILTTLLSAALHPTIQEGVRKIIGNWYLDYVNTSCGTIDGYAPFLLAGCLPWATQGDLFTSTLISTRTTTYSTHGAALANVIARFISDSSTSDGIKLQSTRRMVITGVLDFILDARGKIFQVSILYLLEGLIKGLEACPEVPPLQESFGPNEVDKLLRVSRLPGLPEVAGDLYAQYCYHLYSLVTLETESLDVPGLDRLRLRAEMLEQPIETRQSASPMLTIDSASQPLRDMLSRLDASRHESIQGDQYAPSCKELKTILDQVNWTSTDPNVLHNLLNAFWEEADRRQFTRPVSIHLPSLLFHPTCIHICLLQHAKGTEGPQEDSLQMLLSKAIDRLQRLSEGRPYIVASLAISLRKAVFECPDIVDILPIAEYILRFLTNPASAKVEFLFEVDASQKLQRYFAHRSYFSYYGEREWHAYAAMIDLLQRFPAPHIHAARRILDRILEPWKAQRVGVPIISKWKNVLQLQAMLVLTDFCISETQADIYLDAFRHALILEAWPRYRFLLEWIVARIYCHFPGKAHCILDDLAKLDENSSVNIASLMKLAVLVAPHQEERFSTTVMTQLVPFSASPKVQIRHESNYAIPIIFDLASSKGWTSITENPAFVNLNAFIRRLDKFQSAPWTIRTLKLDALNDFTIVHIFQGQYLTIESPEIEHVKYEDFLDLIDSDKKSGTIVPTQRVSLGMTPGAFPVGIDPRLKGEQRTPATPAVPPAFFQTKSGFDIDSLHPSSDTTGAVEQRPASVMLIASLIDNPTNLGGLSRISESFGLEALYIDDLRKTAHKDFKATSVTSEKHFPIRELKVAGVPDFLLAAKTKGYEVVGIEQTDRSGILGIDVGEMLDSKDLGTLPKKCVLVLGSEKGGISADVLAVIDRCVEIRTVGVTRSLNVQTAGGIAVYEWWREWNGKP